MTTIKLAIIVQYFTKDGWHHTRKYGVFNETEDYYHEVGDFEAGISKNAFNTPIPIGIVYSRKIYCLPEQEDEALQKCKEAILNILEREHSEITALWTLAKQNS